MRILIDLQGAQTASRTRGIGRYSLALAQAIARNAGGHEIWLLLNGAFDGLATVQHAFDGLVPRQRMRVFDVPLPVAEIAPDNLPRSRNAELLREYYISELKPDAVLLTSLFEGFVDDAVTSVGAFANGGRTAVVLYDLIPFINPATYLGTPAQQEYYARKIDSLRRAGLLLAISDHSRDEALQALGLDPQRVVAISSAVDPAFRPGAPASAQLRAQLGITREIVMCAPGGTDSRKNIEGLISAYAMLAPALRTTHQLLIASGIDDDRKKALRAHAARCGLAAHELLLTGHVSDAALIDLYRTARLFVFPSLHEGFGLPALEAMACGAPVIGADNTSIPEVIGNSEALFDASSPSEIAACIARVLQDPELRERLRTHGARQAGRFSWDESARRALRALEAHRAPAPDAAPPARRRLAFVSPLPPARSGIADYAVQLLPALLPFFDVELIIQQAHVTLPASLAALPRRTSEWFLQNGSSYDQVLYQFGNSPFHGHMFPLLEMYPGVVVLHDFFLGRVLAYEQVSGALPGAWTEALYHSHGYPALRAASDGADIEAAQDAYPCNLTVLENATEVIVHSQHALDLATEWYGESAIANWHIVPLPRAAPADAGRAAARAALGIDPDAFVVCSFGFIAPTKLTDRLLQGWLASSLHLDSACELVFVGANHGGAYGADIAHAIRDSGAGARIRISGWTEDAAYQLYLQAADAAVQLRSMSRGETSAAVLDCMNYGLPTIVNASGSMAALPDAAVSKLRENFSLDELVAALERLRGDQAYRTRLGANARALLRTEHSPDHCAQLYAGVLEHDRNNARTGRRALASRLTRMPGGAIDAPSMRYLAACMARLPDRMAQRQLLVDVTNIAHNDLRTGIERVVRAQLAELLRGPLAGLRVEPVRLCANGGRWQYRYARAFATRLLGIDGGSAPDAPVDVNPGDVFFGADYVPAAVAGAAREGLYAGWRARGVDVVFQLYDLLPVLRPEFFPLGADRVHAEWLKAVCANGDRLICISAAVAEEARRWMTAQAGLGLHPQLAALHLGADLDGRQAPAAATATAPLPPCFDTPPVFLMVGTIEPRKGHLQVLDAFERLWAQGSDARLVIVGNEGWIPLARAERRTIPRIVERLQGHAQLGNRLLWLKDADDAQLEGLYRQCACLLAPSEGEGFGLPLIEAARHGIPILARDLPVFREVAGTHAAYFSGTQGDDLAAAVRGWLAARDRGETRVSNALPWLTWQQHAARLLELLGV